MKSRTDSNMSHVLVLLISTVGTMVSIAYGLIITASKYVAEVVVHQEHPKHAVIHNGNLIAAVICLLVLCTSTSVFAYLYSKYMNRHG